VHWPYTIDYAGSFMAAQVCAALMLMALMLFWRFGSWAARGTMLAGVWLAALAVEVTPSLTQLGYHVSHDAYRDVLAASAVLGTLSAVLSLRPGVAVVGLIGQVPLWLVSGFVKESDLELSSLHLAWMGLLVGLLVRKQVPRTRDAAESPTEPSYAFHDGAVFVAATLLAVLVCVLVMRKRLGTADEWGYTFQASIFAKGRAYAASERCQPYLENFYVFESEGKLFSQYTPGWPLFLTPFFAIGAVWLGGPVSMGIMAVGVARLARSAMRGFGRGDSPPSARLVRIAGTWAAVVSMFGTSILINGGSRYPHVFVVGLFAWSVEAIMMLQTPLPPRDKTLWGVVLGSSAVISVASRPADGAFVGIGLTILFTYALARRRIGWRGFLAATLSALFWTAISLVILHAQLGKWFTTGYSLNAYIHPWNVVKYTKPTPAQWKYGLPLATGSYEWWPASIPLGLAGLAMLRGRALGILVALATTCLPYIVYCMFLDLGQRGFDWGYGPRYLIILLVPMAVGGAVAMAPLTVAALSKASAGRSVLARGGPFALAAFAVVSGWIHIVPLAWPTVVEHTRRHAGLQRAVADYGIHNAIVIASKGTTGNSEFDLPTNLPFDLYPDPDVILAIDRQMPYEAAQCLSQAYPGRRLYAADGYDEVRITPY
jgi:hypothetical protein